VNERHASAHASARHARKPAVAPARGFTLVIALTMLAVIGLASAAIMRNATSANQIVNSNRLHMQASQYAQLALGFCEAQFALAAPSRSVALQPAAARPAWSLRGAWMTGGAAHSLLPAEIGGALHPHVPPQCLMEATALPDVYTVTARGFSADYKADPATGATRTGSVVWLQVTIQAEDPGGPPSALPTTPSGPSGAALSVRKRIWQQLLTPPF